MTDLYRTLGVRKNASDATIKSAYRNKAKRVHPDAGGSKASFEELKLARDTLLDPAARAYYDSTGKINQPDPGQGRGPVLALIAALLQHIVGSAVKAGAAHELKTNDVVDAIANHIKKRLDGIAEQKATAIARRDAFMLIIDRFGTKEADGENVMRSLVLGSLSTLEAELQMSAQQKALHETALALVNTHTFRQDIQRATRYDMQMLLAQQQHFGILGGSSTA